MQKSSAPEADEIRRPVPGRDGAVSLPELMALTVREAAECVADLPAARRHLDALVELGLGYLTLGEATPALSGGEAQRLKLAGQIDRDQSNALFVFDEPSVGLHPLDVRTLVRVLDRLVRNGATVVVIEHDLDMIANTDWLIDMGPGGGESGGQIVASGTPDEIAANDASVTGRFLRAPGRTRRLAAPVRKIDVSSGQVPAGPRFDGPSPSATCASDLEEVPMTAPNTAPDSDSILAPGTKAPDFELNATPDQKLALHELRGKPVVLVFYPADWSAVCGDELSVFNAALGLIAKYDAVVLGISVDSVWSHAAYSKQHKLGFDLLADYNPKGAVATSYGAYDAAAGCCKRALFVIDREGTIAWSYLSPMAINPGVDGVLDALEQLPQNQN